MGNIHNIHNKKSYVLNLTYKKTHVQRLPLITSVGADKIFDYFTLIPK